MNRTPYIHSRTYYPHNTGLDIQANLRVMYSQDYIADNRRAGADVDINGIRYQIKSSRATACHTHSAEYAREEYADADGFIFVDTQTERAYIMDFDEYVEFIKVFAEYTRESNGKNGGHAKIRFNRQFKLQTEYLEERVQ